MDGPWVFSRTFSFRADPVSKKISQLTGWWVSQFSIFCCSQLQLKACNDSDWPVFLQAENLKHELKKQNKWRKLVLKVHGRNFIRFILYLRKNKIERKKAYIWFQAGFGYAWIFNVNESKLRLLYLFFQYIFESS